MRSRIENNLLRIAQEAVSNAIKHGHAARITVDLKFLSQRVVLKITDDGRGFVARNSPSHLSGHFGLLDMRERAEKIGASYTLNSSPSGTEIVVEMADEINSVSRETETRNYETEDTPAHRR
jgi:signal transduction histidine kinase